jgi:hypothetical protein
VAGRERIWASAEAEAIEAASAALWDVAHEHDSLHAGRTWATAREDPRFARAVAHMRWKVGTVIRTADKVRCAALARDG